MDLKDSILQRIDELLEYDFKGGHLDEGVAEIASGTLKLFELLYDRHSPQVEQVLALRKQMFDNVSHSREVNLFRKRLYGYLRALKSDVTEGRIVNLQTEARGEVFGDFIVLARRALDEGEKNVAAVLACAALEDSLKQCANSHNLNVGDEEMSTVINALKSKGVISRPDGTSLKGYTQLRNKAFHAQWDEIDIPHLQGLLAFTEGFLVKHFSYQSLK